LPTLTAIKPQMAFCKFLGTFDFLKVQALTVKMHWGTQKSMTPYLNGRLDGNFLVNIDAL